MSEADLRSAYNRWHAELGVDLDSETPWHRLIRRYLDHDRDLAGRRVLDVGAGRGDWSLQLTRHPRPPAAVAAADFALGAVAQGNRYDAPGDGVTPAFLTADIQSLPFGDAVFDTVFSCETIEHLPDPAHGIGELARVLRPGGRLFLTTPNYLNFPGLYRGYLRLRGRRYREAGQPLNRFMTLPWALSMVRRAGLAVEGVDSLIHPWLWPGRPPKEIPWPRFLERPARWLGVQSIVLAHRPGDR
jgi:SAM-dependent methyltransferase